MLTRLFKEVLFHVTSADQRRFVRDYVLPEFVAESLRGRFAPEVAVGGNLTRLRRALWCGASERAEADLAKIVLASQSRPHEVAGAAWILGTFHGSMGQWQEALENAEIIRQAMPNYRALQGRCLLEADALMALSRPEHAREVLLAGLAESPGNPHLLLALSNTYASPEGDLSLAFDDERLRIMSEVLALGKLEPLSKRDADRPLHIGNLRVVGTQPMRTGPLVSVIVPAFNAATTLEFALRGLCEQSWQNLEILVVDDRSPDETFEVAKDFGRRDSRVRAFQMPENRGAYAARNYALAQARGDLVTVHDADDWSHPRKIEMQARELVERSDLVANESEWVRTYPHLYFRGTARVSSQWVTSNISSMMLRRKDLDRLGGWDEVRVAADSELQRRLMHLRNRNELGRVLPGVPLSFALELPSSLTRRGATHVHTISYGVRRTYHDASKYWLSTQTEPLPALGHGRSFPAPTAITVGARPTQLDAVFVMDFLCPSRELRETWRCIRSMSGRKVGIFQLAQYPANLGRRLPGEVLRASQEGLLYVVAPGEEVECGSFIIMKPSLLSYRVDLPPRLAPERIFLVARGAPGRSGVDDFDSRQAMSFVQETFGLSGEWLAGKASVRRRLVGDERFAPLAVETLDVWIESHR